MRRLKLGLAGSEGGGQSTIPPAGLPDEFAGVSKKGPKKV